ncbi:uncharacterized protein [Palaemon carinicauda]
MLQNEDYFHQDESILRYVNASSQMRYLLMPLLRRARSVVPPEYLPHTPLLVRATPSLRLLPRPDATTLIHTARKIVTRSGFLVRRGHVTIMAGHDEAADLWLAANFLTGRIYKNGSSPVATADLGGGTLQVTVPLNGPPEYIKKAIIEKRMKSDSHQENGKTKERQEGPIRNENANVVTGEKGAPLRDQNKTSNYGSEIKSGKHIKKENGERRVSVSVNRRLKNNLNNNSSHDRTTDLPEVSVSDEDSKSNVSYGVLLESETPRNVYDRKSMINNSMKIDGIAQSVTTPDQPGSTEDSILYVTAANFEFRTPPPRKNKEQLGGDKKIETTSTSPTASSPRRPIPVHNMTTLLSPSGAKNRTSRKRKGYGRRGKSKTLLRRDQTTESITEANKTSQDTFGFDVLPTNDSKNLTHIRPRGEGIKSNVSSEKEVSGKEKINLPSAREPRRRRQRGRDRIHSEEKKGKVGKRRSQRGEVDKRDDQHHKREKLSFSHQASSTLMPIDRSTFEKVGRKGASEILDNFSGFPKPPQLNRTTQRRNQRKRKLKKPTRRKQGMKGRKSRKNRIKGENKYELSQENQPIRQTSTFPQDRHETGGVSISSLHEGDMGSRSNPLNVGRGSVSGHQGSGEMSLSISFETSADSTKDKQDREPRRPELPVGGSIPIDENDPSSKRDRQSDSDINIPESPSSATREKNLGGNYSIRRKEDPRCDKTPNTRINSPSDTLLQDFSERRNEFTGKEHESPSTDSAIKHKLVKTNVGDSRREQKTLRNASIIDEERAVESLEYDRISVLKEESKMPPVSMNMEQIPKKITPILEDQGITHLTHKADDESLQNISYAKTKINNHRPLSFDNDILDTRYNGEFLTKEENLVQADNDTRSPIYAAGRQTPTHTTKNKNQSRSITLKDRRRQPQSPLQIGKAATATTENTSGRAKDDKNSPEGTFADVHSPQGVRSSRQRHRHRHRHLHRKKDRRMDTLQRRKRNILEGKYGTFRKWDNRYEEESKQHYIFVQNLYPISVAKHKRRDRMTLNHENNIHKDKSSIKRFMSFKGKNMLIHWINNKYNQMCKDLNVRQCNNLLYNKLIDHSYHEKIVWQLTKNMSPRMVTRNEIKTLIFKMISHRKQKDLNNVRGKGERYDNTLHGWTINNKNNNSFLSIRKSYSNKVVNTSVPLGPQTDTGHLAEVDSGFRSKRELRNLFDAPNITYRCSPSQKYWLFASSLAMGIYPARVKVLQSGNIVRISPTPKDLITTPSPPTATTPRHRSDIPLEEEYPELTAGYDAVDLSEPEEHVTEAGMPIPSPPPEMPRRPSLPPGSPSTPPMVITSKWMEETLSKVKNVVDSILKAIGSREAYVEALNDDGTATRIDVDIQRKRPTQGQPPSRGQQPGALPRRRRPGRKGISRRRKPIGGGREGMAGSHQMGISGNDTMTITRRESDIGDDRRKTPDQRSDARNGSSSSINGVQTYDVTLNRTLNLSHNVPLDVSNIELTSQSVPNVGFSSNITMTSDSTSGVLSEDLNLIESDLVVNHSSSDSITEIKSNSSAPSKKTLSSVTDLLFTVPNERVINPAEDSQVKSEIKSTEKLIRTSLEDLLFRVPANKQHPDSEVEGSSLQDSNITEGHPQEDSSSDVSRTGSVTEHSTNTSPLEERKEPTLVTSRAPTINQKDAVSIQDPHKNSIENEPPVPTSQAIENESLAGDSSIQKLDLILRTACLPVGSIGRFKVQDVTYLVTGLGPGSDGEDCWREVSNVVKTHIKLPSLNHTTLLATTAFYFVAANANLIEPDMAYGFVRVEQFRIAANIMCSRKAEELPDPLACLDYQYIAALLTHGLQLPGHTEILVCEKIHGFRLGWALGAALNYLQKH